MQKSGLGPLHVFDDLLDAFPRRAILAVQPRGELVAADVAADVLNHHVVELGGQLGVGDLQLAVAGIGVDVVIVDVAAIQEKDMVSVFRIA